MGKILHYDTVTGFCQSLSKLQILSTTLYEKTIWCFVWLEAKQTKQRHFFFVIIRTKHIFHSSLDSVLYLIYENAPMSYKPIIFLCYG